MYRLLAIDLDGTLLRHDKSIDARDIAAIAELQRAGVTVTIATGRLRSGAAHAAETCAIAGPIACVEGSHLVDYASNTTLAHHPMPHEHVRHVLARHELATFVFDADGIHHDHASAAFAHYVATWSPNLRVVEDELAWQSSLAAVAIGTREAATAAHAALRAVPELFAVTFEVSWFPGNHAVLVRAAGPTKGTALVELCRLAGTTVAEAVAIGDWVNDIPMLETAGRSFAMGSAPDGVRAAATDVLATPSGDGGGIAEAIRRAWG